MNKKLAQISIFYYFVRFEKTAQSFAYVVTSNLNNIFINANEFKLSLSKNLTS